MGKYRGVAAGLAFVALFIGTDSSYAGQNRTTGDALQHFERAVQAYAALHRGVERTVAPLDISSDARTIHRAVEEMASAMRTARPSARAGDIFNADASALLRDRMGSAMRERGCEPAAILAAMVDDDEAPPNPVRAVVNGRFPWAQGSYMPPCLLQVLPSLPAELEYRLSQRDLVLVDTHAGLVVDILTDALPVGNAR